MHFFDLPTEVRDNIYDHAIEIITVEPEHPWEPFETVVKSWTSLLLVNKRVRDEVMDLFKPRTVDITFHIDTMEKFWAVYNASFTCRLLYDAKIRLCATTHDFGADFNGLQGNDESELAEIVNFVRHLKGFWGLWVVGWPGMCQTLWSPFLGDAKAHGFTHHKELHPDDHEEVCGCGRIHSLGTLEFPPLGNGLKLTNYHWFPGYEAGEMDQHVDWEEGELKEGGAFVLEGKVGDIFRR